MKSDELKAFVSGLQAGLGLTKSAEIILKSPQQVSQYLISNPDIHSECREAIAYSSKVLLVQTQEYLSKKKFSQWRENAQYMKSFVNDLNLWEGLCKANEITEQTAFEAISKGGEIPEAATLCGMTSKAFISYIMSHPILLEFTQVRNAT